MSKVVAIMSMSLDGFVADRNDGVAEVFDWYFTSGDVEIHTGGADPMTFHVSQPSAEHLRGLISELGAMLTSRLPMPYTPPSHLRRLRLASPPTHKMPSICPSTFHHCTIFLWPDPPAFALP